MLAAPVNLCSLKPAWAVGEGRAFLGCTYTAGIKRKSLVSLWMKTLKEASKASQFQLMSSQIITRLSKKRWNSRRPVLGAGMLCTFLQQLGPSWPTDSLEGARNHRNWARKDDPVCSPTSTQDRINLHGCKHAQSPCCSHPTVPQVSWAIPSHTFRKAFSAWSLPIPAVAQTLTSHLTPCRYREQITCCPCSRFRYLTAMFPLVRLQDGVAGEGDSPSMRANLFHAKRWNSAFLAKVNFH